MILNQSETNSDKTNGGVENIIRDMENVAAGRTGIDVGLITEDNPELLPHRKILGFNKN